MARNTNPTPEPPTMDKRERLTVEMLFPEDWDRDAHGVRCPECGKEWVNGTEERENEVQNNIHVAHLTDAEEAWARGEQQRAEERTELFERRAALGLGTEADDR